MKCENCPALKYEGYEYPESYCGAGVPEDGKMVTDCGCRYTAKQIVKRMRRQEDMRDHSYDGMAEWYIEHQKHENAMMDAINNTLENAFDGQYICYKSATGDKYYPTRGNGKAGSEFALNVLQAYEDAERKIQLEYCGKCRWKNRPQKCACCRRNRNMRDLYEEDQNEICGTGGN